MIIRGGEHISRGVPVQAGHVADGDACSHGAKRGQQQRPCRAALNERDALCAQQVHDESLHAADSHLQSSANTTSLPSQEDSSMTTCASSGQNMLQ